MPATQLSLAQALAQSLGGQIHAGDYRPAALGELLAKVPVKLGGGKATLALSEVLPAACVRDLEDICADYERSR